MLDFGTRMPETAPDREDDLFTEVPERNPDASPDGGVRAEVIQDGFSAGSPDDLPADENGAEADGAATDPEMDDGGPLRHFLSFRRKRREDPLSAADRRETAEVLKEARLRANLSLEDVERETQIRVRYLSALENGDLAHLPQQVYVLAYLRKLCGLYRIPAEDEEELVRPWRALLHREVPENLPGTMIADDEPENPPRRNWLAICLAAAAAVLVIGIVTFLVVWVVSFLNRDRVVSHFDHTELLDLQPKPHLTAPAMAPVRTGR